MSKIDRCGSCGGSGECPECASVMMANPSDSPGAGCWYCKASGKCPSCGGDGRDHGPIEASVVYDVGDEGALGEIGINFAGHLVPDGSGSATVRFSRVEMIRSLTRMDRPSDLERAMDVSGDFAERIWDAFTEAAGEKFDQLTKKGDIR